MNKIFEIKYHLSHVSERKLELAIGYDWVKDKNPEELIEVGNVLNHHFDVSHRVVDLTEKYKGVINKDILTYIPEKKFKYVISISTMEHIEEFGGRENSIRDSFLNIKDNILEEGGEFLVTMPTGYWDSLDILLKNNEIPFSEFQCYKRISDKENEWDYCELEEAVTLKYKSKYDHANSLIVGLIKK